MKTRFQVNASGRPLGSPALTTRFRTRLLLHLSQRRQQRHGLLAQGFTLVELMIVIVIVGVLAAVAIPNFLAQTEKAKATEAKSAISAILKQAQAQYQEDGADPGSDLVAAYKAPADDTTKFNYTAVPAWADPVFSVTATGNGTDSAIDETKVIVGCVNMDTGIVKVQSNFDTPLETGACEVAAP